MYYRLNYLNQIKISFFYSVKFVNFNLNLKPTIYERQSIGPKGTVIIITL